jgi:hypothetical protein
VTLDKINISCIEPIPQALVWPTYQQQTSQSGLQPPHLLLPPLQQSLQPPPLALLGSDYLTASCASTTLHQVSVMMRKILQFIFFNGKYIFFNQSHLQHTSTHSTRLVALSTSDASKRATKTNTMSMPMPTSAHTLIKIEDSHHHQQPSLMYEHEKSIQQSMTTSNIPNPTDLSTQLFYQHPGLIQIAAQSQPPLAHQASSMTSIINPVDCRHPLSSSPPPLQLTTQNATTMNSHSTNDNVNHHHNNNNNNNNISNETCFNIVPSCPPEVQDANIQTSPIMSEDDNTSGHDDIPESNTLEYEEESQDNQQQGKEHTIATQTMTTTATLSSSTTAATTTTLPVVENVELENRDETMEHRASVPDTSVTSSSLIVIKQQIASPDTSIVKDDETTLEANQSSDEQREPVDLSGLQLLSNSIDVFQNTTTNIKREPQEQKMEKMQITSPTIASTTITPPIQDEKVEVVTPTSTQIPKCIPEDLGGLKLLCALAEQRLEEDFHHQDEPSSQNSIEKLESSSEKVSSVVGEKKKKHHKVKSSKKSKHKEEKKAKKRKHSSEEERDEDFKGEMAASLKRVKTKFDLPVTSVNDVFCLMEDDMKAKLANITRQLEEKKRELKQMNTAPEATEKGSSSPSSTSSAISEHMKPAKLSYLANTAPLKFSIVPALSPSFSTSSNSNESIVDIPKLSTSDTSDSGSKDDAENERSKRKFGCGADTLLFAKKSKSNIFVTKYNNLASTSPTLGSWTSSISKNGKASLPFVKQEEQGGIIKESAFKGDRVFAIFGEGSQQKFQASSPLTLPSSSRSSHQTNLKHHSKHKKHKERRRHRERKRLDTRCMITEEHLKQTKTRVLMAQGGLFYAGSLSPVEQNEIFAITLDGERGNRPHIMPREEILKQAVSLI